MGLTTSIPNAQSNASNRDQIVQSSKRLAGDVLWPASGDVDVGKCVPAGHFAALAEAGLFGMAVSADDGGLGLAASDVRAVMRVLGGACGATAFAFAQHFGTTGAVASTTNQALRDRWLPSLISDTLAGIAYAHVRRPGPPVLAATETADGWVLNGKAPWVTSWGSAGVFGVAAATGEGQIVWALVPGSGQSASMRPTRSFDLMVFGATQTVALEFNDHLIEPDLLLSVVDVERWAARDRVLAVRPNPLCVGVGDRALALIAEANPDLAAELEPEWDAVAQRAETQCRLVDEDSATVELVAASRSEVLLATQRLTTALLATVGGAAMERTHPAQRLAREAQFYVVQAQNSDGRAAILKSLTASAN